MPDELLPEDRGERAQRPLLEDRLRRLEEAHEHLRVTLEELRTAVTALRAESAAAPAPVVTLLEDWYTLQQKVDELVTVVAALQAVSPVGTTVGVPGGFTQTDRGSRPEEPTAGSGASRLTGTSSRGPVVRSISS